MRAADRAGEDSMIRDARQRSRAWKGTALLLFLFGCALFIFFLDDVLAAFERRYSIVVVMESAPRLVKGSPVWIGGKRVGVVSNVVFLPTDADSTSTVALTLELPRKYRELVRADSRVRVTSARRIGEPVVDLQPGNRDAAPLTAGDTLRLHRGRSIAELTARARAVRIELDTALREVQLLMPAVQARLTEMRRSFAALDASMAETRRCCDAH